MLTPCRALGNKRCQVFINWFFVVIDYQFMTKNKLIFEGYLLYCRWNKIIIYPNITFDCFWYMNHFYYTKIKLLSCYWIKYKTNNLLGYKDINTYIFQPISQCHHKYIKAINLGRNHMLNCRLITCSYSIISQHRLSPLHESVRLITTYGAANNHIFYDLFISFVL